MKESAMPPNIYISTLKLNPSPKITNVSEKECGRLVYFRHAKAERKGASGVNGAAEEENPHWLVGTGLN